jgi:hypothetical protein
VFVADALSSDGTRVAGGGLDRSIMTAAAYVLFQELRWRL